MVIGEDGAPHGVSMLSDATFVNPGNSWIPVPPMTAMRTLSSGTRVLVSQSVYRNFNKSSMFSEQKL